MKSRAKIQKSLDWMLRNQPNNLSAINSLLRKLERVKEAELKRGDGCRKIGAGDGGHRLDEIWVMDEVVLKWKRRFLEVWKTLKNEDIFPKDGSLAQFAGYCLFLKEVHDLSD